MQFFKYEGLGNDFVVVDASDEGALSPERAVTLCDRRFGIGADGVILVLPPRKVVIDVLGQESEPTGHPLDDRGQTRAVGFSGCDETQTRHGAPKLAGNAA